MNATAAAEVDPQYGGGASIAARDDDHAAFSRLYEDNFSLLVAIAVRKFQVPEVDAEALAHEVFLSYLMRKDEIRDLHHWLIGAICHASRYFWRQNGRGTERLDPSLAMLLPDPKTTTIMDLLPAQMSAREALEALPARFREILRLRYYEGYSIREIAEQLGVTAKYTQKLVTKSLRRAEKSFSVAPTGKKA